MRAQVRFHNLKLRGSAATETLSLEGSTLRIGRGADQDIRLNQLRVALAHAELQETTEGAVRLVSRLPTGVLLNGALVQSAGLTAGDEIEIAGFRLQVQAAGQRALVLEVHEDGAGRGDEMKAALLRRSKLSLAALGLQRRRWAYAGAGVVLALCLMLPLVSALWPQTGLWARQLWSAGEVTSAHGHLGQRCEACHDAPFQRTRNEACESCHRAMPTHVALGAGQRDPFAGARCSDCHHEHAGRDGLVQRGEAGCIRCHAHPARLGEESSLGKVTGFAREHPQFRVALPVLANGQQGVKRVLVDTPSGLREDSGLEFSHVDHLAAAGLRDREKKLHKLACADCHQPERGGRMAPVKFEQACHQCHSLKIPGALGPEVPHADVASVVRSVEDHFMAWALKGGYPDLSAPLSVQTRHRPGTVQTEKQKLEGLAWAQEEARQTTAEMFQYTACGGCHHFKQGPTGRWDIQPVQVQHQWFPAAHFDHGRHETLKCASCHEKVAQSGDSAEVSLPGIAVCRDCHGDAAASPGKVASSCIDCHGFHTHRQTKATP